VTRPSRDEQKSLRSAMAGTLRQTRPTGLKKLHQIIELKHIRSWVRVAPSTLTLTTILIVGCLFLIGISILDFVELKTYDLRFVSRGSRPSSPAVVMAVIDEKSLDAEGRWPWPRAKLASLVDALSRAGARVIAFDIGFSEPDENSQLAILDEISKRVGEIRATDRALADFLERSRQEADNDARLAAAIRKSSASVILGYFFHMTDASLNYGLLQGELERRLELLGTSKYPTIISNVQDLNSVPLIKAYAPETNLPALTEAAKSSGFYTLRSDWDGVLRWMPLVIRIGDELFPPLPLLSAWYYLGKPGLTVRIDRDGVHGVRMGDRFIPTDERGQLLVNYLGPAKTFPYVSVTDILNGTAPDETFKDRIVLIGATAIGTHDLRTTPFGPVYPGLEVHATVIDNILTGRFMARPDWSRIYDIVAIVALAAIIGFALPKLSPLMGVVVFVAVFVLYVVATLALFVSAGIWLSVVYPLFALSLNYTALTAFHYLTEQRERKRIKGTFRQYVAPLVVEEMLKKPGGLKLGGEEKVLTVLFSDLEGFTSHSERYTPGEMVDMLADYYNSVTEEVFSHQGTLKEYVGDELMAIFGAPLEHADHAERACATALAMRERRLALAAEWGPLGRPMLHARTGINSGPMLVGNLGSKYRFAYGVLGDQVNLASRLEGLNKVYRTDILIGENTARTVEGRFLLREVDLVRVKGRKQAVRIYELLAKAGTAVAPELEKALTAYAQGLQAYRERSWNEAIVLFNEALAVRPSDGPSREMLARCEVYLRTPCPDDWDGVFDQLFKG
jgi:adenylate cyclase